MPVISRPPKSNNLHNDLTSPANQMLVFLALTEGFTSVQPLVKEMHHLVLSTLFIFMMILFIKRVNCDPKQNYVFITSIT